MSSQRRLHPPIPPPPPYTHHAYTKYTYTSHTHTRPVAVTTPHLASPLLMVPSQDRLSLLVQSPRMRKPKSRRPLQADVLPQRPRETALVAKPYTRSISQHAEHPLHHAAAMAFLPQSLNR